MIAQIFVLVSLMLSSLCVKMKTDKSIIELKDKAMFIRVKNCSANTIAYYKIGLQAKVDSSWVSVISDISNFTRMEVIGLREIKPGQELSDRLVISKIPKNFIRPHNSIFRLRLAYRQATLMTIQIIAYNSRMLVSL